MDRIFELKASGRTIFFCSHAMYFVSTLCDRAIWLNAGAVAAAGRRAERRPRVRTLPRAQGRGRPAAPAHARRSRRAASRASRSSGADGGERDEFRPNEPWAAEIAFEADSPERLLQVHLGVATLDNVVLLHGGVATRRRGAVRRPRAAPRARERSTRCPLGKGEFVATVFLGDEMALALYDSKSRTFRVESDTWRNGLMRPPLTWEDACEDRLRPRVPRAVGRREGRRRARGGPRRRAATTSRS